MNIKNIYNTNNNIFYINILNYNKIIIFITQLIIFLIWILWITRKIIIFITQIIIFLYEYFELYFLILKKIIVFCPILFKCINDDNDDDIFKYNIINYNKNNNIHNTNDNIFNINTIS
jgi:hypothetical protein